MGRRTRHSCVDRLVWLRCLVVWGALVIEIVKLCILVEVFYVMVGEILNQGERSFFFLISHHFKKNLTKQILLHILHLSMCFIHSAYTSSPL